MGQNIEIEQLMEQNQKEQNFRDKNKTFGKPDRSEPVIKSRKMEMKFGKLDLSMTTSFIDSF